MVIDFHVHPGFAHDLAGLREEFPQALRMADHYRVDHLCLCSLADWTASPSPEAVRAGNDAILALMAEYRGRVLGFCYVNPCHTEEALAEIERCVVGAGMAGIKLWIACKASDPKVDPIAEKAAELGVPILQHAAYFARGTNPSPTTPADVAALAARHPRTQMVMAHMAACGEAGLSDIAPYPNVSVDCAGHEPEAGWTELAVRWLGAHRVVFGTDSPIRSYGMSLGKVLGARLTARQREPILGGNARRLLARSMGP
jgi:hypothetical protein